MNDTTWTDRAQAKAQIEAVKQAAAILRAAFPTDHVSLTVHHDDSLGVSWFGLRTYAAATQWLRALGCGRRQKTPNETYTALNAESPDGISWSTYPDELPPTCHKVKKVERVRKTQTVETGEFIEVTREVVECGPDPDEVIAANMVAAAILETRPMLEFTKDE